MKLLWLIQRKEQGCTGYIIRSASQVCQEGGSERSRSTTRCTLVLSMWVQFSYSNQLSPWLSVPANNPLQRNTLQLTTQTFDLGRLGDWSEWQGQGRGVRQPKCSNINHLLILNSLCPGLKSKQLSGQTLLLNGFPNLHCLFILLNLLFTLNTMQYFVYVAKLCQ